MTGKQKRYLRALGNNLETKVQIGKEGITEAFLNNLDQILSSLELVKIRILNADKYYKKEVINALIENGYNVVGDTGFTILVYKENKELENSIKLPE